MAQISEKDIEKEIKQLNKYSYPVNNVYIGESYYRNELSSYAISRFVYENLPPTIPQFVLESTLLNTIDNKAILVNKNNKLYVQSYHSYGVGVYDNLDPTVIYANPILKSGTIDTNILNDGNIVLFENFTNFSIYNCINRYAKKLAQYDSSLDVTTVNTRNTAVPVVDGEVNRQSIVKLLEKVKGGEYDVLVQKAQSAMLDIDSFKYLPTVPNTYFKALTELAQLRNNEKRNFLMEIGVVFPKDKTQAVLSDESQNEMILPLYRLTSELEARKDICEKINSYGYKCSVKLNPILEKLYNNFLNEENKEDGDINAI